MNKEEFKAKANQTIEEVSAKINELKAKQASAKEEAKHTCETAINDQKIQKGVLLKKYKKPEACIG